MTGSDGDSRVTDMQCIRLRHLDGARAGACVEVCLARGATALLGRTPDADVAFTEADGRVISRRHAMLWLASDDAGGWHVVDLASTAGTLLNGRRVHVQRLAHGDLVSLGNAGPRFSVEIPAVGRRK